MSGALPSPLPHGAAIGSDPKATCCQFEINVSDSSITDLALDELDVSPYAAAFTSVPRHLVRVAEGLKELR